MLLDEVETIQMILSQVGIQIEYGVVRSQSFSIAIIRTDGKCQSASQSRDDR